MALKNSSKAPSQIVPDPADVYERARPGHESGMGRLDNNSDAVPEDRADVIERAVHNRQDPTHQINADEEDRKT